MANKSFEFRLPFSLIKDHFMRETRSQAAGLLNCFLRVLKAPSCVCERGAQEQEMPKSIMAIASPLT